MKTVANFGLVCLLLGSIIGCQQSRSGGSSPFVFDADERLFTVHAFMNVGGYDMEFNDDGMHPIRTEIRALLKERLPQAYQDSIRSYYANHKHSLGDYGTYAFALTSAPTFGLKFDSLTSSPWASRDIEGLPGLDRHLRAFYRRAKIGALWQQYRPRLQEQHDKYRPYASVALEHLQAYVRVEQLPFNEQRGKLITAFSPLLSHFQAFTVTVNGDVYLVFGPQPSEPSPSSYYHEAAHHFTDPIVERYHSELERLSPLLALAQEQEGSVSYNVVEESLVRTIDVILTGRLFNSPEEKVRQRIENEYRLGFILCPYLYENLPAFEASDLSLEAYFPKLLSGLDVEKEKQRWTAFWDDQGAR